jgi:single-stranded-DNA-specific exonuclease
VSTEAIAAAPTLRPRWKVRETPAPIPEGDWPPLIGVLLANRGVHDAADARDFLALERPPAHPALPDLDRAVERLACACRAGESVAAFGDFDVDGVTAAALLTEGLSSLGAKVIPYIPNRFDEGYGLNNDAVRALHEMGATLLVTADCGTSSIEEIALATGLGMDAIVLDHHVVPDRLPEGAIIVNPKRDASVQDEPAACGVAYFVLLALHEAMGQQPDEARMLDLVALGTVCDMAPLLHENRRLVREGLAALRKTERPGLRALLEVSNADQARVDTQTLGFSLGPRLNAAGRLAHARLAFDLLTATDEAQAAELAGQLDALNKRRQQETEAARALAEELAVDEEGAPLLMIGHEDFPLGIVGLVAARLAESRHRPAVVYQRGETESRASCRSIPEFHITEALRSCKELFVRYGGHRAAAGFTVLNEHLPELKERLLAFAERELAGLELAPEIDIDAEIALSSLRGEEIRWLSRLAPYGIGNREPVFLSRNVIVAGLKPVGAGGRHLRLKLRDGAVSWPAIAFRHDGDGIEEGAPADVVYSLSADRAISDGLELRVVDVRPAANA